MQQTEPMDPDYFEKVTFSVSGNVSTTTIKVPDTIEVTDYKIDAKDDKPLQLEQK